MVSCPPVFTRKYTKSSECASMFQNKPRTQPSKQRRGDELWMKEHSAILVKMFDSAHWRLLSFASPQMEHLAVSAAIITNLWQTLWLGSPSRRNKSLELSVERLARHP
eukprot:5341668-Amphidinium_carterae.1